MFRHTEEKQSLSYSIRTMAWVVIVEAICIVVIQFWPAKVVHKTFRPASTSAVVTHLKAPVITIQHGGSSVPPSPQVPIPVPNDQPVNEKIVFNTHNLFADSNDSSSLARPGGAGNGSVGAGNPEVSPSVTRIVEPTYQTKLPHQYLITVKFLVNKRGTVDKATIVAIYELDENGNRKRKVETINPKVKQAVIKAALNWEFIPAKDHGKPVQAYTENYFTV